nr:ATP synthase F0 subunit 6 [Prosthogonimus pellucidus]
MSILCFRLFAFYNLFSSLISGSGLWGGYFREVCLFLLFWFFFVRAPYIFDLVDFLLLVFLFVFSLHVSAMLSRLESSVSVFLSSFVPSGVSSFFGFFLCVVETISYLIRPFVLVLRPFLNFTIGGIVGHSLLISSCCWNFENPGIYSSCSYLVVWFCLLAFLFYEWFVSVVQWYIINSFIVAESSAV